jgi:hypothetical protein
MYVQIRPSRYINCLQNKNEKHRPQTSNTQQFIVNSFVDHPELNHFVKEIIVSQQHKLLGLALYERLVKEIVVDSAVDCRFVRRETMGLFVPS